MHPDYPHCGNAVVQYWEAGTLVGSRTQYCAGYSPTEGEHRSAFWPHTAYFCPKCGEIWGRETLNYQFQYSPIPDASWVIETRRCAAHGDGQFLVGKDAHLTSCSPDLLRREYLVLTQGIPTQATVQHQPPTELQTQRLVSARNKFQTSQKGA